VLLGVVPAASLIADGGGGLGFCTRSKFCPGGCTKMKQCQDFSAGWLSIDNPQCILQAFSLSLLIIIM
jgi:hypothetical protein